MKFSLDCEGELAKGCVEHWWDVQNVVFVMLILDQFSHWCVDVMNRWKSLKDK